MFALQKTSLDEDHCEVLYQKTILNNCHGRVQDFEWGGVLSFWHPLTNGCELGGGGLFVGVVDLGKVSPLQPCIRP